MGLSREIEQLKRRANKVVIQTKLPEIQMHILEEGDPEPRNLDVWSIVVRIEGHQDYYPEGGPDKQPNSLPGSQ